MSTVNVKNLFFDRGKVIKAMDNATRQALSKAGAHIMTAARSSIKSSKAKASSGLFPFKSSPPGSPPRSHVGLLKKIFFSYDPRAKSVVVGPLKFGKGTAPRLLEEGGAAQIVRKKIKRTIKIEPRPYMGPALKMEQPSLPSRWSGQLKG